MELVGLGVYTYTEASRLTGINTLDLKRWLHGRQYKKKGEANQRFIEPIWRSKLEEFDIEGLSFHDLLEVRFVKAFRDHGVPLQTIRIAAEHAKDLFDSEYPFTCERFQTDGRTIFAEAIRETGETQLLDLRKKQFAFNEVIRPSLYRGIEFDDGLASRWFPGGRKKDVVLDPEISFGKPIITEYGIRTDILYDAYLAEDKNKRLVAAQYDVPLKAINSAIKFEERLAA